MEARVPTIPLETLLANVDGMRRLAHRLVRDPALADDVAQEAVLVALSKGPRHRGNLRGWLFGVVRNLARESSRKAMRRAQHERAVPTPSPASEPVAHLVGLAEQQRMLQAVEALSEPYRRTIWQRYFEDLPPRAIARRAGIPVDTVHARLRRARVMLRAKLDQKYGGDRRAWALGLAQFAAPGAPGLLPSLIGGLLVTTKTKLALLGGVMMLAAIGLLSAKTHLSQRSDPATEDGAALLPGDVQAADPDGPGLRGLQVEPGTGQGLSQVTGPWIRGLVVDETGNPIAGARIVSLPDSYRGTVTTATIQQKDFPGSCSRSDEAGRFVVPVSGGAPYHFLAASAVGFSTNIAPGAAAEAEVRIELARAATLVGLVKTTEGVPIPGATVRAWLLVDAFQVDVETLTNAEGRFRLEGLPRPLTSGQRHPKGFLRTNWFEVRAEGFAALLVEDVRPLEAGADLTQDFTLSRGAILTGRVTDAESGEAIADARIVLYSIEGMRGFKRQTVGGYACPFAPRIVAQTTSDDEGAYVFEHIPCRGAHASASHNSSPGGGAALGGVLAWKAGYAGQGSRLSLEEDGASLEAPLKLWLAARVKGRLVHADGSPMTSASVSVQVAGREFGCSVPKGLDDFPLPWVSALKPDGSFLVSGAPASREGPTDGTLRVFPRTARGRSPIRWKKTEVPVTLKVGQVTDVGDIVLDPPEVRPTTRVLVLSPDGRPFFGATLACGKMGSKPRTDASGLAEWIWGKPSEKYPYVDLEVLVRARGYAPTVARLHPPGSGKETVTVTLRPAHRIAGRVVHADGAPAANIMVGVGNGSLPVEEVFPIRFGTALYSGRHAAEANNKADSQRAMPKIYASVITDEQGRFEFTGLPDGPYHVVAAAARRVPRAPRGGSLRAICSGVDASAEIIELRMPSDDSPPVGSISGCISGSRVGSTLAGLPGDLRIRVMRGKQTLAYVFASNNAFVPSAHVVRLDAAGRFKVPSVPVGVCQLQVAAAGYHPQTITGIEVRTGRTTRVPVIELERGVAVSGHVRAGAGLSLDHRQLVFQKGVEVRRTTIQKDGTYRLSGFEAGSYVVTCQPTPWDSSGFPLVPDEGAPLVIPEGAGDVKYDVSLGAGGWIVLMPTDERFPPLPWSGQKATVAQTTFGDLSHVRVVGPRGSSLYEHKGIQQGRAGPRSWLALPPGRYTVRLEMPEGEVREVVVDLEAKAKVELRFDKP